MEEKVDAFGDLEEGFVKELAKELKASLEKHTVPSPKDERIVLRAIEPSQITLSLRDREGKVFLLLDDPSALALQSCFSGFPPLFPLSFSAAAQLTLLLVKLQREENPKEASRALYRVIRLATIPPIESLFLEIPLVVDFLWINRKLVEEYTNTKIDSECVSIHFDKKHRIRVRNHPSFEGFRSLELEIRRPRGILTVTLRAPLPQGSSMKAWRNAWENPSNPSSLRMGVWRDLENIRLYELTENEISLIKKVLFWLGKLRRTELFREKLAIMERIANELKGEQPV